MTNSFIGWIGCIVLYMGIYYGNIWRSKDFPFLSQLLFYGDSNSTYFHQYNQTLILTPDFRIDEQAVKEQGLPWLTGTYVVSLITTNMGITATFVYMLLWNWNDLKSAWAWAAPSNLKKWLKPSTYKFWVDDDLAEERLQQKLNDHTLDPHYRLMLRNGYKDTAQWWWAAILIASFAVGLGCLYAMKSTLPWWGFIVGNLLTLLFMLFFGAQYGLTGFSFNTQPVFQMLAGYMFPGKPLASEWSLTFFLYIYTFSPVVLTRLLDLYFTCFTYNSLGMGQVLAKDLRLAQNTHVSPRCTFFVQVLGCIIGALFNFVMMLT